MIVIFVGYSRFGNCKGLFAIYTSESDRVNAVNNIAARSQILGIINAYYSAPLPPLEDRQLLSNTFREVTLSAVPLEHDANSVGTPAPAHRSALPD